MFIPKILLLVIAWFLFIGVAVNIYLNRSLPKNLMPVNNFKMTFSLPNEEKEQIMFNFPSDVLRYKDPYQTLIKKDENYYTIMLLGDVMLGRSINTISVKNNNFSYPFDKVSSFISTSDITLANLESPFNNNCPLSDTGMVFCADKRSVEGLIRSGVDVVSIANNHIGNQGQMGLDFSLDLLNKNNIKTIGNNDGVIAEIRNKKFGFLAYNYVDPDTKGISWATSDKVSREVKALSKKCDFMVVSFHFGEEYKLYPNKFQREISHLAVDSGADLIVGHHSHWVQGVESYNGKYIFYSLGNFVFDQLWSVNTMQGLSAQVMVDRENNVVDISLFPVILEKSLQTRFATKEEAVKILERIKYSTDFLLKKQK